MNVLVNIEGQGTVGGEGSYKEGDPVELLANPGDGWKFKYFQLADGKKESSPYVFIASSVDVVIKAIFYVSVEDYLRGKVDFDIPDGALNSIFIDRGIKCGEDVAHVEKKILDLCYADILMWATTTSSTVQGARESDNGWAHQDESKTLSVNDKKRLEERALSIYRDYGDPMGRSAGKIKIISML